MPISEWEFARMLPGGFVGSGYRYASELPLYVRILLKFQRPKFLLDDGGHWFKVKRWKSEVVYSDR